MRELSPGYGTLQAMSEETLVVIKPDGVARALIILSPDIGAQYFKDVAEVVNAGGLPDKAALVAVMSRYGLVPSAPK